MKATHVKLKTWPQKAWSPIFPNQTLLQISLFYTRIHVWWTNLPSPASSALTGNHPLRQRHRPAAALSRAQKTPVWWQTRALSTIKFYISTKKKQRNVFLALSCWLSSRSSHTRVLPAQIWGLRSSLQTAYDANISITLFCFYCTSVWHIGAVTEECVFVCVCVVYVSSYCRISKHFLSLCSSETQLQRRKTDFKPDHNTHRRHFGSRQVGRFAFASAGHSPITRSLSAPTTTSCSSAEKSSFPEVDLTSNILPRALNPLDPKANTHTRRGGIKEERLEPRSERIPSESEHLKCREKDIHVTPSLHRNQTHKHSLYTRTRPFIR